MSKAKEYPHTQPFNVTPRRNSTKKNSWWATPPYTNVRAKKGEK